MNEFIAGLPVSTVVEAPTTFNMLIYGHSGAGKTRLAGSADAVPELRRILFVDVEGGTLTLKNTPYNNIEVVRVKTWEEMENVYNVLNSGQHHYNTVIIDSLTEIQKLSMDRIMKNLVAENEGRDADVPGVREWNINIEQLRKYVRKFRDLPVNTIFTALEHSEKNMMTGATLKMPSLSGKVKAEVAAFLDIVVYLYMKQVGDENKRLLLTAQTQDTVAKDRSNKLPMIIENPTMAVIYEHLFSNKEIDSEPAA